MAKMCVCVCVCVRPGCRLRRWCGCCWWWWCGGDDGGGDDRDDGGCDVNDGDAGVGAEAIPGVCGEVGRGYGLCARMRTRARARAHTHTHTHSRARTRTRARAHTHGDQQRGRALAGLPLGIAPDDVCCTVTARVVRCAACPVMRGVTQEEVVGQAGSAPVYWSSSLLEPGARTHESFCVMCRSGLIYNVSCARQAARRGGATPRGTEACIGCSGLRATGCGRTMATRSVGSWPCALFGGLACPWRQHTAGGATGEHRSWAMQCAAQHKWPLRNGRTLSVDVSP